MRSRFTRREFGLLTLAPLAWPQIVGGVQLGVQTYSFRDLPKTGGDAIDGVIDAMQQCGFTECELYSPQVGPRDASIARCEDVGRKFKAAGMRVYAFNISPNARFSDGDLDRMFEMAAAIGAQIITSSTQLDTARRLAPFAERHKVLVAMHGHSNAANPNEFATPESFEAALRMSSYFRINLDIGHFTAAGYDALPFIESHQRWITNLHIKDMIRGKPESYVPWGQGDAPIKDVLRFLQRERSPIRAYIEYEYRAPGAVVDEVKKCLAYAKSALA